MCLYVLVVLWIVHSRDWALDWSLSAYSHWNLNWKTLNFELYRLQWSQQLHKFIYFFELIEMQFVPFFFFFLSSPNISTTKQYTTYIYAIHALLFPFICNSLNQKNSLHLNHICQRDNPVHSMHIFCIESGKQKIEFFSTDSRRIVYNTPEYNTENGNFVLLLCVST